ncbi:MAG: SpoIIE family protein phosphatase [Bacteroidota bacterium]|jgi:sigma-B regulation protein RsbU (phosphoserine phosphatase)
MRRARTQPDTAERKEASDFLPLFEFSNVVNSSLDLDFILSTVLRTLMGKMLVTRGMVFLKRSGKLFQIITAKGIDHSVIGQTLEVDRPLRSLQVAAKLPKDNTGWFKFLKHHQQSLIIPILSQRRIVGYITLGERLSKPSYSAADKRLIQSLVSLSGAAIEKALIIDQVKEANRNLDRKIQELNTLFDLSKEFNVGLDEKKVVRLVTFALLGQIGVKKYALCLRDPDGLNIVESRIERSANLKSILPTLCDLEHSATTQDLLKQKAYRIAAAQLIQIGITAVVPMHIQHKTKGMILLGERLRGGVYTRADLEFLYSLGNLAIISIENAHLFKDAIEKQRMEDELNIAREIQQGLLPEKLPSIPGFDIAALTIPSKEVGGDYYDIITRQNGEYILAIGDVSGKGTPAALLMANVQAALRALAPHCTSVSETTGQINDLTCANTRSGSKFITFFWGILDAQTHQFRFSNAGHNPPYLLRKDGTIEGLEEGGLILGVFKTITPYAEASVILSPGDVLVMYTDGVSEAMNQSNDQFTEEQLEVILKESTHLSAKEIIQRVQQALESHTQGTPQSDDITMLVLKAV